MMEIKIDNQVFEELQTLAQPFVDSPNDVLRRLLGIDGSRAVPLQQVQIRKKNPAQFLQTSRAVQKILAAQFSDSFSAVKPYRFMYEGEKTLIYFQNFDKITDHLWYRLNQRPWDLLAKTQKTAFLCLTCPAMRFAYLIPFESLDEVLSNHLKLRKDSSLEINIKVDSGFWTELEWNISRYRIEIDDS